MINDRKDGNGMGEPGCCNPVVHVALSCTVVSIVLGEEGRTDFGLHKPRGESNNELYPLQCRMGGDRLGRAVEVSEKPGIVDV